MAVLCWLDRSHIPYLPIGLQQSTFSKQAGEQHYNQLTWSMPPLSPCSPLCSDTTSPARCIKLLRSSFKARPCRQHRRSVCICRKGSPTVKAALQGARQQIISLCAMLLKTLCPQPWRCFSQYDVWCGGDWPRKDLWCGSTKRLYVCLSHRLAHHSLQRLTGLHPAADAAHRAQMPILMGTVLVHATAY